VQYPTKTEGFNPSSTPDLTAELIAHTSFAILPETRVSRKDALLEDLLNLSILLKTGAWDERRQMGVELELVTVESGSGRPWYGAPSVIANLQESHGQAMFTGELLKSNIECALPPHELGADFLKNLRGQIANALKEVAENCSAHGAQPLMTGMLPTYTLTDFDSTDFLGGARYQLMNDALLNRRGGSFTVALQGIEAINLLQKNMSIEGSTTSFQLHLSASPEKLVDQYNIAMAVAAPLLAVSVNSPIICGQMGWHETRVGLLEHGVTPERFFLGSGWKNNPFDLFADLAKFESILNNSNDNTADHGTSSAPALAEMNLMNGTVWKWIRPCYGVDQSTGLPHLRIENRILPAGPTVSDMCANAAFNYGLQRGLESAAPDIVQRLTFEQAQENFQLAAKNGMNAEFTWLDGQKTTASALIEKLLPVARDGLLSLGVSPFETEYYLDIIRHRAKSGQTGSQWVFDSLKNLEEQGVSSRFRQLEIITELMLKHQLEDIPVSRWPIA